MADASRASMAKIAENVQRYAIDCRFRHVPGYLYTEKRKYVAELKNEASAAREAGLDAQWVTSVPLPAIGPATDCTQKVPPTTSTHWLTIAWPLPTTRATAPSQSLPTP